MQLTIHRGANEVGGNCIEVQTQKARLILDLGMPLFAKDRQPLDTMMLKRLTKFELKELGFLPNIPGLFEGEPSPDAILLTHGHLDHTGLIQHSQASIPIYASSGTSKMMLAGRLFAGQVEIPRDRFKLLQSKQTFQIGDIQVTAYPVDHSIYGCMGLLIESDGKCILYPGDIRLHGRKPGMMRDLVDELKGKSIDVLLMEGTHFGLDDGQRQTEYELEVQLTKLVAESRGLVLASFSPQHVDRLVAFIRVAIKTKRTLVADIYTTFVMHLLRNEIGLPQPSSDGLIRTFYPKFFLQSCERKRLNSIAEKFQPSRIELPEVLANPARYLMTFRPSMLQSDFNGELPNGSLCIYSRWEGYLENQDWKQVISAIEKASGKLDRVHTSGHILSEDIVRFTAAIDGNTTIPIHTFEPHRFPDILPNVKVLDDGEEFNLE